jgi:hypothetical protein
LARVVSAIGTSHSPMLPTSPRLWLERADQDRNNPMLYDDHGRHTTYDQLAAVAGDRYAADLDLRSGSSVTQPVRLRSTDSPMRSHRLAPMS